MPGAGPGALAQWGNNPGQPQTWLTPTHPHISAPSTPTAKRGPSRLGCSTVTLMAIFVFPAQPEL